jgi:DNA-binding LacI/PurR family transcriptional regulator
MVDKNASSLRSQRTHTLALLFFEDPTPDESMINPFFLSMLGSITRECALRGYDLLISFQQMHNDWHVAYQDSHRSDGIILLGYGDYQLYLSKLEHLVEMGTNFVRWGSVSSEGIGLTVGSDNVGAGEQAGAHLVEIGRRAIAFLGDASDHAPEFQDRYTGLCRALRAANIVPDAALQRDAISSEASGYAAAQSLLAGRKRFDAIFAASDLIAIGAMRALSEAGLTTVMQDMKGAGTLLVDALLASIDGRPVEQRMLPARLIRRQSTAV